jgi:predicted patatin/cPLA2 family phospholipase
MSDIAVRQAFAAEVTTFMNTDMEQNESNANKSTEINQVWSEFKKLSDYIIENRKRMHAGIPNEPISVKEVVNANP